MGAYSIVRYGKMVDSAPDELSGQLLRQMLCAGDMQSSDLVEHVQSKTTSHPAFDAVTSSLTKLQTTMDNLLQTGFVHVTNHSHYRNDTDNRAEAERVVPQPEAFKSQSKREREAQRAITVQRQLDEWHSTRPQTVHFAPRKKRQRTNGHHSPEKNPTLRVNMTRLALIMRHCRLVDLAERDISKSAAFVYQTVLRLLEPQMRIVTSDEEDLQISTKEIVAAVPKDVLEHDSENHYEAVQTQLMLLAQGPLCLLTVIPEQGMHSERWILPLKSLRERVIFEIIVETAVSRFGNLAIRLINVLAEKGKLDEKTLCSICLVREKEMRNRLSTMHQAGMLELQEVPRDNARVASRTNFLYFFDQDRCSQKLLDECYKTITRCLQRLEFAKAKVAGTLEKASRSDVVGNEEDLLSMAEREGLSIWRVTEETILVEVGRIDKIVAILRDF